MVTKLTGWLVSIIGLLLLLEAGSWVDSITQYNLWLIAIAVMIIGIAKLKKAYKH